MYGDNRSVYKHRLLVGSQVVFVGHSQEFTTIVFQSLFPSQTQCPKMQARLLVQAYVPGHVPLNVCTDVHRCPSQNVPN